MSVSQPETRQLMRVGIALGSNLGDRLEKLRFGREELLLRLGDSEPRCSKIYETEPIDCPEGAKPFYNAVIEIETDVPPEQLLIVTQAIEAAAGRKPEKKPNAPRPLDLDILYIGSEVVESAALTVPHPRLHERRFVLQPLSDIRPKLVLPNLPAVDQLLAALPEAESGVVCVHEEW